MKIFLHMKILDMKNAFANENFLIYKNAFAYENFKYEKCICA